MRGELGAVELTLRGFGGVSVRSHKARSAPAVGKAWETLWAVTAASRTAGDGLEVMLFGTEVGAGVGWS